MSFYYNISYELSLPGAPGVVRVQPANIMLVGWSWSLEFPAAPAARQHWPAAPASPAAEAKAAQLFSILVCTMPKGRKPPILQVLVALVSPYLPLLSIILPVI